VGLPRGADFGVEEVNSLFNSPFSDKVIAARPCVIGATSDFQ
jgi:hypothetical protein